MKRKRSIAASSPLKKGEQQAAKRTQEEIGKHLFRGWHCSKALITSYFPKLTPISLTPVSLPPLSESHNGNALITNFFSRKRLATTKGGGIAPSIQNLGSNKKKSNYEQRHLNVGNDTAVTLQTMVPKGNFPETKKWKKSQQLYLDFGQRNFAKRTICRRCGMMYVHGIVEDLKEHSRICFSHLHGVPLGNKPWKKERVVYCSRRNNNHGTFDNKVVAMPGVFTKVKEDRIIEIRDSDPLLHRKKVVEIKRIADQEMGFVAPMLKPSSITIENPDVTRNGDDATANALLQSLDNKRCYLYISSATNIIVGLCIAEAVTQAHTMIVHKTAEKFENIASSAKAGDKLPSSDHVSSALVSPAQVSPCALGVYQLWTHSNHRSKGVATLLIDAARASFFYGTRVPRHQIAFSSPTVDGMKFAARYCQVGNDESTTDHSSKAAATILVCDFKLGVFAHMQSASVSRVSSNIA